MAFDACSGDYWVLDALGHRVVRCLLDAGAQSTVQLQVERGQVPGLSSDVDDLEPALARLFEAGLIQPVHASAP